MANSHEVLIPSSANLPKPKEVLDWEALEYEPRVRTSDWYWTIGTITALGVIVSVIINNYLFAVILLLAAFSIITHSKREPRVIAYAISPRGVRVGDRLYPYNNLRAFWMEKDHEPHELVLHSDRVLVPHIFIPLGDANSDTIQTYLLHYLPEEPHEITVAEVLEQYLGF